MNYVPPRRSDGTSQTTRVRQPWPVDRPFRILTIDGGGIRGVFPAAYLAELEQRFVSGASIAEYFDMIAGTSTGGIIALALAYGLTAKEALAIYQDRGPRIFPSRQRLGVLARNLRWIMRPKYNSAPLKNELLQVFGDAVLDAATTRLVIPSFEGRYGEPFIYKTPHHPDYQKDRHQRFAHVALHTTAAPSYFPGVEVDGYIMLDGGVWANNPVMNAVVDALACFDIPRENVRVLSLGTGEATFTVNEQAKEGGAVTWAWRRAFDAAARAQSKNALGQAYLLVGKPNVVRIDPPESDQAIQMDDVTRALRGLPLVARSLVEGSGHHVEALFLKERALPFLPCAPAHPRDRGS
ncbi:MULTISPECIES: CBASS cGAMP-activated phospholipase [Methylobacterium]|uniref:PNPLA domain-containing protein n=2 Tax=Pseudomonadota TaxID=1224 RepID=A0ABQ4SVX8_9HYPH|nr:MULTISPECIES: CBASS cGAMP-activated phospholipase [Methylobacterium]PIU07537.1 MAG: patatin [Methylobacterium sp. CG09_land_8_20_14_0_10_71_15]PIU13324.1 MAG: patatin [Methylobacterium sp. CG08_land_8_20_14_0_20_71_15]GBU17764.1 patatin [Methylobacterium sp.]GJE06406.1 hypothetical protein AOPFMNJM_1723 [Methylobacterium jeotgali]